MASRMIEDPEPGHSTVETETEVCADDEIAAKSQKEMEILGIEPKTSSILGDSPANEAYYHCTISPFMFCESIYI